MRTHNKISGQGGQICRSKQAASESPFAVLWSHSQISSLQICRRKKKKRKETRIRKVMRGSVCSQGQLITAAFAGNIMTPPAHVITALKFEVSGSPGIQVQSSVACQRILKKEKWLQAESFCSLYCSSPMVHLDIQHET